MAVERDSEGRMVFKASPEVFTKMVNRLAEGWCYKAFARETQERFPILFDELHKFEKELPKTQNNT